MPRADKPRYRNRKGEISVNVLGVCDKNMNFIHILTGWEGSAADSRVLRDAITRPQGFKVPTGMCQKKPFVPFKFDLFRKHNFNGRPFHPFQEITTW